MPGTSTRLVSTVPRNLAPLPSIESIDALIDAAFWTSLRREEGYVPTISLALVRSRSDRRTRCSSRGGCRCRRRRWPRSRPRSSAPGIHLGVSRTDGDARRSGATTRTLPPYCLVLEVAAPGLLVVKQHRGGEQTKFANIAVLEADQVKIVDENASSLPDCPSLLTSLLGFDTPASWSDSVNVLVQLVGLDARARARRAAAGRPGGHRPAGASRSSRRFRTR